MKTRTHQVVDITQKFLNHIEWLTQCLADDRVQHMNTIVDIRNHYSVQLTAAQNDNFILQQRIKELEAKQ